MVYILHLGEEGAADPNDEWSRYHQQLRKRIGRGREGEERRRREVKREKRREKEEGREKGERKGKGREKGRGRGEGTGGIN